MQNTSLSVASHHAWYASYEVKREQHWPYLEGEHKLVALEEAEACVVVHIKGQGLHNIAQASLKAGCLPHKEALDTVEEAAKTR